MPYLYILFLSTLFVCCTSVPKEYSVNNAICHYDDPIFNITEEELVLSKDIQKQLQNQKSDLVIIDNDNYKNEYFNLGDNDITNIQTNKNLNISKWIRYKNNKAKWILFKNRKKNISKETHYDQQGEIIKVIDHEKGYNICWAEAIEIVKKVAKKDIKKYEVTGFNLSYHNLNEFPNEKPEWGISLEGNEIYKLKDIDVYRIDGVTGKFLRKTKIIITHE